MHHTGCHWHLQPTTHYLLPLTNHLPYITFDLLQPATYPLYLPPTTSACHLPPLPATPACHLPPQPATYHLSLPPTTSACHLPPQPATYLCLLPTYHLSLPPTSSACHLPPLPATYLQPLPATYLLCLSATYHTCPPPTTYPLKNLGNPAPSSVREMHVSVPASTADVLSDKNTASVLLGAYAGRSVRSWSVCYCVCVLCNPLRHSVGCAFFECRI